MMEHTRHRIFSLLDMEKMRSTWMRKRCGSRISPHMGIYRTPTRWTRTHIEEQTMLNHLIVAIVSLKAQE